MDYKIFGCKVNKYYTDKWLNSDYLKDKEGIFVSTCVVTDRAKKKWIKFVKESINKLNKNEKVYISGCGNIDKGEVSNNFYNIYPELNPYKDKIELLAEMPEEKLGNINNSIDKIYTKKFLLIQSGCDSFCTFCLTVQKRGSHYSIEKEKILKQILDFEKSGGKEVVLTGINLCAWGAPNTNDYKKTKFYELLRYILDNTNIERIRISSIGPEFVNDELIEIFKETRIYPHLHFSVQSGSSKILKQMNRHYDGNYIKGLLSKVKNLKRNDGIEMSIGADIIVGFPGEEESDFVDTLNLVKEGLINKVHVFPFSPHKIGETIPAGMFPNQIDENIKKQRVKVIEEYGEDMRIKYSNKNIGIELKVLIEYTKKEGEITKWKGWTQNYIEVNEGNFNIINGEIKRNSIVNGFLKI